MRRAAFFVGLVGLGIASACPAPKPPRATIPAAVPEPAPPGKRAEGMTACEMATEAPTGMPGPDVRTTSVRVNQVGYRPKDPKRASYAAGAVARLPWALRDQSGQVVARGWTWVVGDDRASGDHVHEVDFSCVERKGFGYRLQISRETSPPFAIDDDVYAELRAEAFAFFYRHRSGTKIEAAYAGDQAWARPAGHTSDADVGCHTLAPCEYRLDASRGWYGDGAMGKYTVGSALAVWTLQNLYERHLVRGTTSPAMADNVLAMPEAGNGHPDVLDAARWHLEWMLSMQVPAEQAGAGLVHHKLHGDETPKPGVAPDADTSARALRPPTTTATLNLAAVAAQAARVWKTHDPKFAKRCLDAAERAFEAARVSGLRAPPGGDSIGGLSYVDGDASDEVFWAATELALATGKAEYTTVVTSSPWFMRAPPDDGSGIGSIVNWDLMLGPATLDLALVDGPLPAEQVAEIRTLVQTVADGYLHEAGQSGYRTTLPRRTYGGATTFDLLRNAIVLLHAHDLSKQPRFRSGALGSLEWLMGRNPLGQVYVTGFGAVPVEHPHHAFWSDNPPPGMLVNGPNGESSDPFATVQLRGCAQQKCYADDAGSISTNRVVDHGNAALAWVVTALAE